MKSNRRRAPLEIFCAVLEDIWTNGPVSLPIFIIGNPHFLAGNIVSSQTEPPESDDRNVSLRCFLLTSVAILLVVSPSIVSRHVASLPDDPSPCWHFRYHLLPFYEYRVDIENPSVVKADVYVDLLRSTRSTPL